MLKPHCSNFLITSAFFSGVWIFFYFCGTCTWFPVSVHGNVVVLPQYHKVHHIGHIMISETITHSNEPPHDKTNKMICAPSEDSDQPWHPPSLIRVFAVRMTKAWDLIYPLKESDYSDQTGQMPRLIWVFAGCTCHFVDFVMRRLKLSHITAKICWCHMQTTKTSQAEHPPRLVSAFFIRCLDSIIPIVCYVQNSVTHASFCSWAGQCESWLVTRFWRKVFLWHGSINISPLHNIHVL